jgi:hypothetical protein
LVPVPGSWLRFAFCAAAATAAAAAKWQMEMAMQALSYQQQHP